MGNPSVVMVNSKKRKKAEEPEEEVEEEEEEEEEEDEDGEEAAAESDGAKKEKKTRKFKKLKDPDAPKKSLSSFVLFGQSMRPKIMKKNPDMKFTAVGAELGKLWKELPEAAKQPYNKKALKDKERYTKEMETYVPSPEFLAKAAKHGAKRMKKDPNKPKRSRSAYLVFCDRLRPGLRKKYPSKTMIDLAGDLSKAWANVSTKEKGACEKIAAEEKAIYEKELKDYKPSAEWQKAVDAIANEKAGAKEKIAEAKKKAKEKMTKAKGKVQELKVEIAKIEKQVQAAAKLKTKVAGLQEDLSRTETKLEALMSK